MKPPLNTTRPNRLVIVRHAESQRNKAKMGSTYFADDEARRMVQGIPDYKIELTPEGITHAEKTSPTLRERFGVFDYAYTSGYVRTDQTLNGLLSSYTQEERSRIKLRTSPFIRERDPGYTYDMTTPEAEGAFPWLKKHWQTFGGYFGRPPGGQSLLDKTAEVYLFLSMIFRDRVGQNVLVVTHGGTIRSFRAILEHWDYERAAAWPEGEDPKNCGITVYEYDPEQKRLILKEYNTVY